MEIINPPFLYIDWPAGHKQYHIRTRVRLFKQAQPMTMYYLCVAMLLDNQSINLHKIVNTGKVHCEIF
jgi:hypothetical protein